MKLKSLTIGDRFDILSEKRLSGVAELRYTMLYGKSQILFSVAGFPVTLLFKCDIVNRLKLIILMVQQQTLLYSIIGNDLKVCMKTCQIHVHEDLSEGVL